MSFSMRTLKLNNRGLFVLINRSGCAFAWAARALLFIGCVSVGGGLFTTRIWETVPGERVSELALIAAILAAVALVGVFVARWSASTMLAILGAVLLWRYTGTAPLAAAIIFAGAAVGIGMPFVSGMGYRRWALAFVVGMLLISGVVGWVLPYPIHDQLVYGLLFGGIWVFRFRVIREAVRRLVAGWRGAIRSEPRAAFFCATVFLLGAMALWVPTVQFDDLAGHLAIPIQLRELRYYRLDAASQVWAMTPWTPDVIQAIVGVLAGTDARGPVNGIWYVLSAYFLWDICRSLELPRALRWLVAAAFASQPLLLALLGGMQVEIVLTALAAT
ncbi:MAG: hypothetical protein ACRD63_15315, partial [Pyrinomonadaceae bacterium]